MSLFTGRPPYDAVEIENVATALATGQATWQWYNSREAQQAFREPLFALKPVTRAQIFVDGGLMLFEFLPPGQKITAGDLVCVKTMKWADYESSKRLLLRTRALEFFAGLVNVPSEAEMVKTLDYQENLRKQVVSDPKFMAHAREAEAKE